VWQQLKQASSQDTKVQNTVLMTVFKYLALLSIQSDKITHTKIYDDL